MSNLRLGDLAPDFTIESTDGWISFHEWIGSKWCVLFSHPKDFTPVCTTELGEVARLNQEFTKRHVKVIALSVNSIGLHHQWITDINTTQNTHVNFPLIGDEKGEIAAMYGMLDPKSQQTLTVRSVFIIDPQKTIRLILNYPASTGRNFTEILRVIDSLQLTDQYSVATPANWQWGNECIILPNLTDPSILKEKFPQGYREVNAYLRYTPQPNLKNY